MGCCLHFIKCCIMYKKINKFNKIKKTSFTSIYTSTSIESSKPTNTMHILTHVPLPHPNAFKDIRNPHPATHMIGEKKLHITRYRYAETLGSWAQSTT